VIRAIGLSARNASPAFLLGQYVAPEQKGAVEQMDMPAIRDCPERLPGVAG
jgi:hypothetical protein